MSSGRPRGRTFDFYDEAKRHWYGNLGEDGKGSPVPSLAYIPKDGDPPAVMLRSARGRGRRAVTTERVLCEGAKVTSLRDEDIIVALLDELLPFIER